MTKQKLNGVTFEIDFDSAPPEVLEWSKRYIGEDDKDNKLIELKQLINEGNITPHATDDSYLLKFLRARNFKVESSYQLLVNYCKFRENYPNHYQDIDPLQFKFLGDNDIIQVLPGTDNHRRILITKLGNWDPSTYSIDDLFSGALFILEVGSLEPSAQILGGICILDFKNITIWHALQITPNVARKLVEIMATSFPLKIYAVHIIFESKIFDFIFKIFYPFLNEKMKKKVFFHGSDTASLHQHVNRELLPKRYGGMQRRFNYNLYLDYLKQNQKIIAELRKLGYVITQDALDKQYAVSTDEYTTSEESD